MLLSVAARAATFVEPFTGGSNAGEWIYGTGNEIIESEGGNPGAYLHDPLVDTFAPQPRTTRGVSSPFVGDYRTAGVTAIGIDLITHSVDFSAEGRPLSILLISDNDTPIDFSDDWAAYFIGPVNIPLPGQGWLSYHFVIPSQETSLPAGWGTIPFGENSPPSPDWNDVITDVNQLSFFYGDPTFFFIFQQWNVGLDNPSITTLDGFTPPGVGDDTCQTTNADTGIPCSTNADCTSPAVCGLKSRYITIDPPATFDIPITIQVEIVSMPQFPSRVGEIWWAGPEVSIPNPPNAPLRGAQLLCEPTPSNAQVWTDGYIHLYGTAIVPGSAYNVRVCVANGANCSTPLLVGTGKWGDVVRAFGGGAQPNFTDIFEIVAKFTNSPSAPDMPRVDLVGPGNPGQPSLVNQVASFADISADVAAFSGSPYPHTVPACPD